MGFTEKLLKSLTNIFLGLHWIAALYAILAPGLIVPVVAAFILGPLYVPAFLIPVGPLSIVVNAIIPFFGVSPLPAIPAYIALKVLVYLAIRRNRMLGASAVLVPLIYFLLLLIVAAATLLSLPGLIPGLSALDRFLTGLVIALRGSTPMDLTTLSYVKFRDAVRGAESKLWIPALVALWVSMLWLLSAMGIPQPWLIPALWNAVITCLWIAVTAIQLLYVALYIYAEVAKRQSPENQISI